MSTAEMENELALVDTFITLESAVVPTERPDGPNEREWAANLGWEPK